MKTEPLFGKVALVTGASLGLGAEIARVMARYGLRVAVNYRSSEEAARRVCSEIEGKGGIALPFQADVTEPNAVVELVERVEAELGAIEILVNNVGLYVDSPFLEMSLSDFDTILASNVRSTFLMCQNVGRKMKARGRGSIVNISATDTRHRSHSVYGLAKVGVNCLTEALALELAPEVRINALAPDLIADNEDMGADLERDAIGGTPMKRLVTRAEVAEMATLLCTPAFAMMTGQTITLDGGRAIPRIHGLPA